MPVKEAGNFQNIQDKVLKYYITLSFIAKLEEKPSSETGGFSPFIIFLAVFGLL